MKYDFGGYATKNDLLCSDGRTIRKDAFAHQDGTTVPLVWQHKHDEPANVLGHAVLENREDGVYAYAVFNDTEAGKNTKQLVHNGDVTALSIYANKLVQKTMDVVHGMINEVSVVLSGANPGALIDSLSIVHDGETVISESEAFIYTGETLDLEDLQHSMDDDADNGEDEVARVLDTLNDEQLKLVDSLLAHAESGEEMSHAKDGDKSIKDVFETFTDEQKTVVYAMIGYALEDADAKHADDDGSAVGTEDDDENLEHSTEGGNEIMKTNVFDKSTGKTNLVGADGVGVLSHAQISSILTHAQTKKVDSLKELFISHVASSEDKDVIAHAGTYGINDIDFLFPDAAKLKNEPDFISRRMEWVDSVLKGANHSPFSRIKTVHADITAAEARAKGYVTGAQKIEEVFGLLKRVTTPTTIYKKQKLDRDDILDITDFNVVAWIKAEMRVMLDEEIARAILIGDGRSVASDDKVSEANIRPIYTDDDLYTFKLQLAADKTTMEIMEEIIRARKQYKGSGSPTLYTTTDFVTDMLLLKDTTGRRLYKSVAEVAEDLRVAKIIEVEVMEGVERTVDTTDYALLGIIVNLKDYNIGADKGGQMGMFDDFDIDYNQYKYLIETRISGALTKPKSAIAIEQIKA